MEDMKSLLLNLLFFICISAEIPGIHVGDKDVEYHTYIRHSSLRDHHVIILDSSERHRRQASATNSSLQTTIGTKLPPQTTPKPAQNTSQTEEKTLVAANSTTNVVNRTTSIPLPTTSIPQIVINDTHEYYTSTVMQSQADNYWVDLSNATLHQDLGNNSKAAKTIQFENSSYLFYGHEIYNVTISTGDVESHTYIRHSSLRDHRVIIVDSRERYRRQASATNSSLQATTGKKLAPQTTPKPAQNTSQTEEKTLVAANTTTNGVNRTISTPLPTTSIPQIVLNDTHEYYTSTVMQSQADNYWVELSNATLHQDLAHTSTAATTIQFKNSSYLFYGHEIYNVTIATGGFLYMSPFVHTFLTATQYTAPLMANFGTLREGSDVYFQEYADRFIVEWRNVYLVDQGDHGPFKFQTILYANGSIVFIYQKVPVAISEISNSSHPVKIGLADAYYVDQKVGRQIIRTVYKYHTIRVNFTNVKAKTVIIFHPLPTCNLAKGCNTCVTQKIPFMCLWCAKVQRCSDSWDWHRQDWIENGCPVEGHNSTDLCNGTTSKPTPKAATTTRLNTTGTPVPTSKTLSTYIQLTSAPSPTKTPVPHSSTTGLNANQTTKTTSQSPTSRESTTTKTSSPTTTLRKLPTTITTPKTTTLKKETSQMSMTNSTANSTTMATTLKPNTTTTNQTTKTTSPSPTSRKLTTTTTTSQATTLRKLTTNITTPKTTTLMKETSQMLTTNTTTMTTTLKPNTTIKPSIETTVPTTTTLRTTNSSTAATVTKQSNSTVAPCNKTKDSTCGQGSQPNDQKQASGSSNATVIAIVIVLVLIVLGAVIGLVVYAYRNPTSVPGQWLIKNRPSALRERVKNVRENFFINISDSSEKYRLESESEL